MVSNEGGARIVLVVGSRFAAVNEGGVLVLMIKRNVICHPETRLIKSRRLIIQKNQVVASR